MLGWEFSYGLLSAVAAAPVAAVADRGDGVIEAALQSGLAGFDLTKRGFPAPLQLRGDQPVVRIAGGVAALGQ